MWLNYNKIVSSIIFLVCFYLLGAQWLIGHYNINLEVAKYVIGSNTITLIADSLPFRNLAILLLFPMMLFIGITYIIIKKQACASLNYFNKIHIIVFATLAVQISIYLIAISVNFMLNPSSVWENLIPFLVFISSFLLVPFWYLLTFNPDTTKKQPLPVLYKEIVLPFAVFFTWSVFFSYTLKFLLFHDTLSNYSLPVTLITVSFYAMAVPFFYYLFHIPVIGIYLIYIFGFLLWICFFVLICSISLRFVRFMLTKICADYFQTKP